MLQNLVEERRARPRHKLAEAFGDMEEMARELRAVVAGEVRFDEGSRALYATDASNYRQVPIGVVIPRSIEDVIDTVRICYRYGAPVLSRGGGTSLCGQCCNVAVVIDFSKHLNRIIEIDREGKTALVQPGVVLDDLREAAMKVGLTFAPDPATHNHNTLGGMIGNNSCGPHSVLGGTTVDNVIELDALTYDGVRMTVGPTSHADLDRIAGGTGRIAQIYRQLHELQTRYADEIRARFPRIPRRVSGYNLNALLPESGFNLAQALVGSEGTCVVVLGARVRLVDHPPFQALAVLGYPDVYRAADHIPQIMGFQPIALEGIDERLVSDIESVGLHPRKLALLPKGGGWLLAEFGGNTQEEANRRAQDMVDALRNEKNAPQMKLFERKEEQQMIWKIRESGLGATAHVPNKNITWEGWEDSAVPPERLGTYLRKLRALFDKYEYDGDLYGHFGQGCVHTRIDFDLETAPGIEKYRRFAHEAAELVVSLGGSISGEHGDGQSKGELLPIMFGDTLMQAFREFKGIWDPHWRMNPGKVINARRIDDDLRLGTRYNPPEVQVHFHYPSDSGNFSRAMLRCVGVGECRKKSGTMCPSYMATGEEMHSTRGRARLLFEMLQGDPLMQGWKSEAVHEALSLCLSCKGCKAECPVSVDMATYKAEFEAHYYEGRLRPPNAYAFGLIDVWARLASRMPRAANFLTGTRPFSTIAKKLAGIAPQRRITPFAQQPFVEWFRARPRSCANPAARRVLLWPDTFSNYFQPQIARAATEVLEHAGYRVAIPEVHLCCGRPLYEFGMVRRARRYLESILEHLDADIRSGTPIVGLEPACVSVFKEELPNLLQGNEQARRLHDQVYLLSDFLQQEAPHLALPPLARTAIVHGHCHHKSVLGMQSELALLRKLGLDAELLDSGCCGMAGSFGFEAAKYDVSIACGERVLLPAVRNADADRLIVADGFSCREQIAQTTGREALHLAQVLRMALDERQNSAYRFAAERRG